MTGDNEPHVDGIDDEVNQNGHHDVVGQDVSAAQNQSGQDRESCPAEVAPVRPGVEEAKNQTGDYEASDGSCDAHDGWLQCPPKEDLLCGGAEQGQSDDTTTGEIREALCECTLDVSKDAGVFPGHPCHNDHHQCNDDGASGFSKELVGVSGLDEGLLGEPDPTTANNQEQAVECGNCHENRRDVLRNGVDVVELEVV